MLRKKLIVLLSIAAISFTTVIFLALITANSQSTTLSIDDLFTRQYLGSAYSVFDLGAVDVNSDGFLDIYTVNHSYKPALFVNNTKRRFSDLLFKLNLTHNVTFNNEDLSHIRPLINDPGLYIYWKGDVLVVEVNDLEIANAGKAIKGIVRISNFRTINTQGEIQASYHEGENHTNVDFSATGDGKLLLNAIVNSAQIELAQNVPLDTVYIGPAGAHANKRVFDITRGGDRHGMAWADFNGDGQTDTFIIRGGQRGIMIPDRLFNNDELMVQTKSGFEYRTSESGITKGGCPGRQVSWVDYDRDGLLDIYVSCGRTEQPRKKYDNQLHRQWENGKFVDIAKHSGLNIPEIGSFLWFDKQNDGYMDLFWAGPNDFRVFLNHNGHFEEYSLDSHNGKISQFTVADYDNDEDFDIFIASSKGNILLENSEEGFESKDLKPLGLPFASISANWVDYDNDGLMDLHVLPGGLYRQVSDSRFVATNILRSKSKNIKAHCTWVDVDNNGARDLVMAVLTPLTIQEKILAAIQLLFGNSQILRESREWQLHTYLNKGNKNHWLEVELIGSKGNRPALGARVELSTMNGRQIGLIGQSNGSHRSQGHYRLYFGLGEDSKVSSISIHWPDGSVETIEDPSVDTLLTIPKGGTL